MDYRNLTRSVVGSYGQRRQFRCAESSLYLGETGITMEVVDEKCRSDKARWGRLSEGHPIAAAWRMGASKSYCGTAKLCRGEELLE